MHLHASFILDEFRLSLDQVTAFVLRKHKAGIRIASLFSRGDCPWWRWLLMRLWAFVLAARLLKGLRERGKEGGREETRAGHQLGDLDLVLLHPRRGVRWDAHGVVTPPCLHPQCAAK